MVIPGNEHYCRRDVLLLCCLCELGPRQCPPHHHYWRLWKCQEGAWGQEEWAGSYPVHQGLTSSGVRGLVRLRNSVTPPGLFPQPGRLPGETSLPAGVRPGRLQARGARHQQAGGGHEGGGDQQYGQWVALQDRRLPRGEVLFSTIVQCIVGSS